MTIVPLDQIAAPAIEALLDRAFGVDRHARTAYRLRAGTVAIRALSFAAVGADRTLAGSIQSWPIAFAGDDGVHVPMILVGPIAVEPAIQRGGLGQMLTRHMLDAAAASGVAGADALLLIGDPEYYERFFGFSAEPTSGWRLPGPFEPRRLLARGKAVPTGAGDVVPRSLP